MAKTSPAISTPDMTGEMESRLKGRCERKMRADRCAVKRKSE
jgi:hypothetical protein